MADLPERAPIKALLLSDLVQERLLADIVTGRYAPGQRLDLDEIAAECGVSRMPVREALQALAPLGLVEASRNARTAVALWSVEDMRERVAVVGRLVAFLASAPDTTSPCAQNATPDTLGDDLAVYLDIAQALIDQRLPRLAEYMRRSFLDPLRLFIRPDVLAAHGVDAAECAVIRGGILADALHALHTGVPGEADRALTTYADEFVRVLTLPGSGIGSDSRASHSPESEYAHA